MKKLVVLLCAFAGVSSIASANQVPGTGTGGGGYSMPSSGSLADQLKDRKGDASGDEIDRICKEQSANMAQQISATCEKDFNSAQKYKCNPKRVERVANEKIDPNMIESAGNGGSCGVSAELRSSYISAISAVNELKPPCEEAARQCESSCASQLDAAKRIEGQCAEKSKVILTADALRKKCEPTKDEFMAKADETIAGFEKSQQDVAANAEKTCQNEAEKEADNNNLPKERAKAAYSDKSTMRSLAESMGWASPLEDTVVGKPYEISSPMGDAEAGRDTLGAQQVSPEGTPMEANADPLANYQTGTIDGPLYDHNIPTSQSGLLDANSTNPNLVQPSQGFDTPRTNPNPGNVGLIGPVKPNDVSAPAAPKSTPASAGPVASSTPKDSATKDDAKKDDTKKDEKKQASGGGEAAPAAAPSSSPAPSAPAAPAAVDPSQQAAAPVADPQLVQAAKPEAIAPSGGAALTPDGGDNAENLPQTAGMPDPQGRGTSGGGYAGGPVAGGGGGGSFGGASVPTAASVAEAGKVSRKSADVLSGSGGGGGGGSSARPWYRPALLDSIFGKYKGSSSAGSAPASGSDMAFDESKFRPKDEAMSGARGPASNRYPDIRRSDSADNFASQAARFHSLRPTFLPEDFSK